MSSLNLDIEPMDVGENVPLRSAPIEINLQKIKIPFIVELDSERYEDFDPVVYLALK